MTYTRSQIERVIEALIDTSALHSFWVGTPLQIIGREILRENGRGAEVDAKEASEAAERKRHGDD